MQCPRCSQPLLADSSACPICGLPISGNMFEATVQPTETATSSMPQENDALPTSTTFVLQEFAGPQSQSMPPELGSLPLDVHYAGAGTTMPIPPQQPH